MKINSLSLNWFYKLSPIVSIIGFVNIVIYLGSRSGKFEKASHTQYATIHIATIVNEENLEKARTMIKSAILMSNEKLFLHIIADDKVETTLLGTMEQWIIIKRDIFNFRLLKAPLSTHNSPSTNDQRDINSLLYLKLFLPSILSEIGAVMYVESNSLFVRPPKDLWVHFQRFDPHHILGASFNTRVTEERYVPQERYVPENRMAGLDSGVMLMNLTRMRLLHWEDEITEIYQFFRQIQNSGRRLKLLDTQLVNVAVYRSPHYAYIIPCDWNFRPFLLERNDYNQITCPSAEERGASIIRGIHLPSSESSPFMAVYNAVLNQSITASREQLLTSLIYNLQKIYENMPKSEKRQLDSGIFLKYIYE